MAENYSERMLRKLQDEVDKIEQSTNGTTNNTTYSEQQLAKLKEEIQEIESDERNS